MASHLRMLESAAEVFEGQLVFVNLKIWMNGTIKGTRGKKKPMSSLIIALVGAAIAALASFIAVARTKKANSGTATSELGAIDAQSATLAGEIEQAIAYISQMDPLAESRALMGQIAALNAELDQEREKLAALEKQLSGAQSKVDKEENEHSNLKRGKEECQRIADEMRSNTERLAMEQSRLDSELQQSSAQMTMLASETSLTAGQSQALKQINEALNDSSSHLKSVANLHNLSSERFLNLEVQYTELEKEYRKLVEKELSGK